MAELDGSCRTPIGGLAKVKDKKIIFYGEILKPDGSQIFKDVWSGNLTEANSLGKNAGRVLKEKGGDDFFK